MLVHFPLYMFIYTIDYRMRFSNRRTEIIIVHLHANLFNMKYGHTKKIIIFLSVLFCEKIACVNEPFMPTMLCYACPLDSIDC